MLAELAEGNELYSERGSECGQRMEGMNVPVGDDGVKLQENMAVPLLKAPDVLLKRA